METMASHLYHILFISPDNSSLGQIIGRHLDRHLVSRKDPDKVHAELARDVGEHLVTIEYLRPKHSAGQNGYDFSFDFYGI